jgi:hypothetical protein
VFRKRLLKVYKKLRKSWGNVEKIFGGTSGREPVVGNWLGVGSDCASVDSRGDLVS